MRMRLESAAVTRIETYFNDTKISSATGFFYQFGDEVSLVTNWHVLSGRNAITTSCIHPHAAIPNRISFNINIYDKEEHTIDFRHEEHFISSAENDLWESHKGYDSDTGEHRIVDIAMIRMSRILPDFDDIRGKIISIPSLMILNRDLTESSPAIPRVGSDVFILGYPRGIPIQGALPIWKRGSVASEPLFNALDNSPVILIDAITREGMSGAPVLYFGEEVSAVDGTPAWVEAGKPWLIGIYAGREGSTGAEIEMTLGRAWKRQLLDDMFFY
ncbi:putative Serine protease [Hyphomicrobiales bacterium]|nr:putative Serine protease [Hyphomicrobiales bacterium]CAH1696912.1 putative Serine protease [Hyphomicrobiales bacterium]